MITTIIFDLDGTLMNTLDDLHSSVCFALRQVGLPENDKLDTRRFLGNAVRNLIWRSVEKANPSADDETKEVVLNIFRKHYLEHSMDRTAPYEGIMEMLAECKRMRFNTAIVSNKLDAAVKDLHQHFFADCIDLAIGESESVRRKPAPDMVNEAIHQIALRQGRIINLEECVYVGDSEVDLATAQNSGLPCIAVSWGFRDKDLLVEQGAKVIIDSPMDLFSAIQSLGK